MWLNRRAKDLLAWELCPRPARSWEEGGVWVLRANLPRMPAEVRSGLSGMNTSLGDPQESGGPPENSRPKEIITLGPGESVRQVILKKIQELSDSVWGLRWEGGCSRRERREEGVVEKVGLHPCLGRHKIRISVCDFVSQFTRSYSKVPCSGVMK